MRDSPAIYDRLWREAVVELERGRPQMDPHLSDRTKDLRRGVTLAFRPTPAVQAKVKSFLDRLAGLAPGQHVYLAAEFHVTVLAIISGSEFWRREIRQLAAGRVVINEVLRRQRPFKLRFQGVTASPGSVMIQGFPENNALEKMRDELREAFARNGLGGQLDRRYRITAAHMTVMRFRQPEADWKQLAACLAENRRVDFGEMEVNRLQLIWGDWYASANVARTLQEYRLLEPAG